MKISFDGENTLRVSSTGYFGYFLALAASVLPVLLVYNIVVAYNKFSSSVAAEEKGISYVINFLGFTHNGAHVLFFFIFLIITLVIVFGALVFVEKREFVFSKPEGRLIILRKRLFSPVKEESFTLPMPADVFTHRRKDRAGYMYFAAVKTDKQQILTMNQYGKLGKRKPDSDVEKIRRFLTV